MESKKSFETLDSKPIAKTKQKPDQNSAEALDSLSKKYDSLHYEQSEQLAKVPKNFTVNSSRLFRLKAFDPHESVIKKQPDSANFNIGKDSIFSYNLPIYGDTDSDISPETIHKRQSSSVDTIVDSNLNILRNKTEESKKFVVIADTQSLSPTGSFKKARHSTLNRISPDLSSTMAFNETEMSTIKNVIRTRPPNVKNRENDKVLKDNINKNKMTSMELNIAEQVKASGQGLRSILKKPTADIDASALSGTSSFLRAFSLSKKSITFNNQVTIFKLPEES